MHCNKEQDIFQNAPDTVQRKPTSNNFELRASMGARQRIATANQAAFKVQQMVKEEPQQGLLVDNPEAGNFHFIKAYLGEP